jgi:hypothetical protein
VCNCSPSTSSAGLSILHESIARAASERSIK